MSGLKVVCGLGNPGKEYALTRHNAGFMAVEKFAESFQCVWSEWRSAKVAKILLEGSEVLVVEPQTFMNLSGNALSEIVSFYGLSSDDLLVVHDDADLEVGRVLLRVGGGDSGHKGVLSVVECLGTSRFARLRIGIGRPTGDQDLTTYVLSSFSDEQLPVVQEALQRAAEGIKEWVVYGVERAQNLINRRDRKFLEKPSSRAPFVRAGPQDRKEVV